MYGLSLKYRPGYIMLLFAITAAASGALAFPNAPLMSKSLTSRRLPISVPFSGARRRFLCATNSDRSKDVFKQLEDRLKATEGKLAATQVKIQATEGKLAATQVEIQAAHEGEKAAQEEEKAALVEMKAAQEGTKAAQEGTNAAQGSRWVMFTDLYDDKHPISTLPVETYDLGRMLCDLFSLPNEQSYPLNQDGDLSRCSPSEYYESDVFGSSRSCDHQLAHMFPHSRNRAARWIAIMELVTATKIEPLGKNTTSLYEKMNEGYRLTPSSIRKYGTGLVFQPYDILCIANQCFLDTQPSCCFFPILSFTEMLNWNGEEYEAIFMGSNAKVVQKVGATYGDLLECSGDDERVQTAFSGFQDAALAMVGRLKSYNSRGKKDSLRYDSSDYLLSRSLGEYLESTPTFRVPSLKNKNTADFNYRIVKFSRAKALGDQPDGEGHPAPVPLLLVAKSMNAWISHLLRKDLLDGFTGNKDGATHCSFFPFCDADGFDAS